jgi:glycine cleavage system H protein
MIPADLRYTKDHEWIRIEGDTGTLGITHYAQGELGDIVYVELPEVGKSVASGDVLGNIESVKAVSEIYAPVAGTVVAVNEALGTAPETVNGDPHGGGWICKLKLEAGADLSGLLDAEAYGRLVGS